MTFHLFQTPPLSMGEHFSKTFEKRNKVFGMCLEGDIFVHVYKYILSCKKQTRIYVINPLASVHA